MSQPEQSKVYQLKISLNGAQPPIWRRILAPGDVSLFELHFILQLAMGWTNSHLHEFFIEHQHYGDPEDDEWGTRGIRDEKDYRLEQVIQDVGVQFSYLYDFGDSWEHIVLVEDILEREEGQEYPALLDGERACPPEDVGGVYGYAEFLKVIRNRRHPEHENYLAWAGGAFDPEALNRQQVDAALKHIDRSEMVRIYNRYFHSESGPYFKPYLAVSTWHERLTEQERSNLEELPLRRDTVTLLAYLRDHRVTGTQSSGNLPLKAVREATAGFVIPPVLEEKVGNRIYKIRSEYDVWSVYFIHALLETGGLLEGGPGRRLHLTEKGEQFLAADPALQVWVLLETWWYHTNWLIAVRAGGIGEHLPHDFELITLDHLIELPAERTTSFEHFAGYLIAQTGLKWTAPDMSNARRLLHWSIELMVIKILEKFGIVNRVDEDEWIGNHKFRKLHAFSITKLGSGLLKAVAGNQLP